MATDYSSTDKQQNDKQQKSSSGRGYALSVALLFPPLCALLGWQSYVQWRAETFAAEAYKERTRPLTSVSAERRKAFSAAAATAAPSDVEILVLRGVCLTDASRLPELDPAESRALVDEAVKVWLTARAASPYHPRPHALLGAYRYALKTGDAPLVYFERARFLQPTDPDMHYFCGMEYWKAGRDAEALQSWQRSLELSPDRYKEILTAAAARLGPQRLAEEIVPDQPNMLRDAANFLYPDAHADAAGRLPFLAKAARLYDASPEPADGRSLYEMGRIYGELGQGQKAVDAMRKATRRNPDRTEWRIELALQHRANRDFKEAVAELRRVLQDDSTSVEARKWFEFVKREVALRSAEGPD